jgi:hypothetical protein
MRSSTGARRKRRVLQRTVRRVTVGAAGPYAAGVIVIAAYLLGVQVTGPFHWIVTALLLVPAVLIHWHNRDALLNLTALESAAFTLIAGAVAYLLIVVGLAAGAASAILLYLAVQTGLLTVAAQIGTLISVTLAVRNTRRP